MDIVTAEEILNLRSSRSRPSRGVAVGGVVRAACKRLERGKSAGRSVELYNARPEQIAQPVVAQIEKVVPREGRRGTVAAPSATAEFGRHVRLRSRDSRLSGAAR